MRIEPEPCCSCDEHRRCHGLAARAEQVEAERSESDARAEDDFLRQEQTRARFQIRAQHRERDVE